MTVHITRRLPYAIPHQGDCLKLNAAFACESGFAEGLIARWR